MSWRTRAPWILAAVLALAALAVWQDARLTRRKYAGVPEEIKALAGKVERLEVDMDALKTLAKEIRAAAPKGDKVPTEADIGDTLMKARDKGIVFRPGSPIQRLAVYVIDLRAQGHATEAERAELDRLYEEVLNGL